MKYRILTIVIILTGGLLLPARQALAAPIAPSISITITPQEMISGEPGYVFISGPYPLDIRVVLDGQTIGSVWTGRGYIAPFAYGAEEPTGDHEIVVSAVDPASGASKLATATIHVQRYGYPTEDITISGTLQTLLDPTVNDNENARLAGIYGQISDTARMDWPFALPAPGSPITSNFGAMRSYNGGEFAARHTGTDFRHFVGDPILAVANGVVVSASPFDIRGNVVIIDHGHGVFSQYAHMSQIYVTVGSFVQKGQVIGTSGATGRAMGPHLHFEIAVGGEAVDAVGWLDLSPGANPPHDIYVEPTPASGNENVGGN